MVPLFVTLPIPLGHVEPLIEVSLWQSSEHDGQNESQDDGPELRHACDFVLKDADGAILDSHRHCRDVSVYSFNNTRGDAGDAGYAETNGKKTYHRTPS